MNTPKITIEITRATAEEFVIPLYTVPSELLSDFVTDKMVLGLQQMGFPESNIDVLITD
ncbi:hypothetical protein ID850_19380 [Xenorhabdus sp. Flor]|uniref:hypothetical protein n=1 Tax=Xenorhabdus cabanillasii TaxID=351673 RepID=UPI0019A46FE0|nr:hypothetical protein [Xenorhabdus sp. Flor]MBD2816831.1 hypothetical protein [Xenorhabdus sp. Flor]